MNYRIAFIIVGVLAFVMSLFLGTSVAEGDYKTIIIGVGVVIGVLYFVKLYQYAGLFVMGVAFSGITYHSPVGAIDSSYMALGLFCLTAIYELFIKSEDKVETKKFKLIGVFSCVCVFLFGVMFVYQILNPVSAHEFSLKQTFKAELQLCAPFFVLIFWMIKSDAYVFRWGSNRPMLIVLYYVLVFHIIFRIYLISQGLVTFGIDRLDDSVGEAAYSLPGGLAVSPYILRSIGPLAVVLGGFILLSPTSKGEKGATGFGLLLLSGLPPWVRSTRALCVTLMFLGFAGALLSSGRSAPQLSIFGVIVAAVYFRHYLMVFLTGLVCFLFVFCLNIFPGILDKMPQAVSRSVAVVIIKDDSNTSKSIGSSSSWREELAHLAYEEWTSDADIFTRGRGVYTFSQLDNYALDIQGGYEAKMISSLRTGNVHVLFLVLGLRFGVVALIFWCALHLSLSFLGARISLGLRRSGKSPIFVAYIYMLCLSFFLSFVTMSGLTISLVLGLLMATREMEKNNI